jgi:hypothetical protein
LHYYLYQKVIVNSRRFIFASRPFVRHAESAWQLAVQGYSIGSSELVAAGIHQRQKKCLHFTIFSKETGICEKMKGIN